MKYSHIISFIIIIPFCGVLFTLSAFANSEAVPEETQTEPSSQVQVNQNTQDTQALQEQIAREQDKQFNDFIVDPSRFGPANQEEANKMVDDFLRANFNDTYYTEKSSVGEMKIIIKDRYLFTNKDIDFSVVQYYFDESVEFSGATYTWSVWEGDTELITISDVDKSSFFYNFSDAGTYQVRIQVDFPGGATKTGTITLDIANQIAIDYRPLNPGAGDTITLKADIPGVTQPLQWMVDGEVAQKTEPELSFKEFKGAGSTYDIEVLVKDPKTGHTKYYGAKKLTIQKPELRINLFNETGGLPVDFNDAIRIEDPITLALSAEVDNISKDTKLQYVYRINDQLIEQQNGVTSIEINPERFYRVNVIAQELNTGETIAKEFLINPQKEGLSANLDDIAGGGERFLRISPRYWGLIIFGIIGVLSLSLSRYGKPKLA